jgi:hypothetical protein
MNQKKIHIKTYITQKSAESKRIPILPTHSMFMNCSAPILKRKISRFSLKSLTCFFFLPRTFFYLNETNSFEFIFMSHYR